MSKINKRIRCNECKTVQGVHKKSCSKIKNLTRTRILMFLRLDGGLTTDELNCKLKMKGMKSNSPKSVLQQLKLNSYIFQDNGKYHINPKLMDPVFFGMICQQINQNPFTKFNDLEIGIELTDGLARRKEN